MYHSISVLPVICIKEHGETLYIHACFYCYISSDDGGVDKLLCTCLHVVVLYVSFLIVICPQSQPPFQK